MSITPSCLICGNELVPIVYGPLTEKNMKMHEKGLIYLFSETRLHGAPNSYCRECHEPYYYIAPIPS